MENVTTAPVFVHPTTVVRIVTMRSVQIIALDMGNATARLEAATASLGGEVTIVVSKPVVVSSMTAISTDIVSTELASVKKDTKVLIVERFPVWRRDVQSRVFHSACSCVRRCTR